MFDEDWNLTAACYLFYVIKITSIVFRPIVFRPMNMSHSQYAPRALLRFFVLSLQSGLIYFCQGYFIAAGAHTR